jgi:hypothetical protein
MTGDEKIVMGNCERTASVTASRHPSSPVIIHISHHHLSSPLVIITTPSPLVYP